MVAEKIRGLVAFCDDRRCLCYGNFCFRCIWIIYMQNSLGTNPKEFFVERKIIEIFFAYCYSSG